MWFDAEHFFQTCEYRPNLEGVKHCPLLLQCVRLTASK